MVKAIVSKKVTFKSQVVIDSKMLPHLESAASYRPGVRLIPSAITQNGSLITRLGNDKRGVAFALMGRRHYVDLLKGTQWEALASEDLSALNKSLLGYLTLIGQLKHASIRNHFGPLREASDGNRKIFRETIHNEVDTVVVANSLETGWRFAPIGATLRRVPNAWFKGHRIYWRSVSCRWAKFLLPIFVLDLHTNDSFPPWGDEVIENNADVSTCENGSTLAVATTDVLSTLSRE